MKIKRWLASFLAVSILLGATPGTVAMAEGLDTESVITHQHTDSCYRLEENCIHNHTDECYPIIESIPEEASPSDAQYSEPTECTHVCSEENGCIVRYWIVPIPQKHPQKTLLLILRRNLYRKQSQKRHRVMQSPPPAGMYLYGKMHCRSYQF